jgi:hypothetical protein
MTQLVTVQMTVNSTEYYMSTEGYQGSNYYEPHIVSLPNIKWAGEGWIKLQAGQMAIANRPDQTSHPFSYATNYNSLITNPDQQYLTAIDIGEPTSKELGLWYGYSVVKNINADLIVFDLYEYARHQSLANNRAVGTWPISSFTAGSTTTITISTVEMGSGTLEENLKAGDQIKITSGGAQSPVENDVVYTVLSVSGNTCTIPVDSTGATFTALQVVTDSGTSGGSAQRAYINKALNTPYAVLSRGSSKRIIPKDRKWQDGYSGKYAFIGFSNWYPNPGYGSGDYETNIYIDGVNSNSQFTVSSKVYQSTTDWDGVLLYEARTTYKNIYEILDLWFSPANSTKAPNSDDDVLAGIMATNAKDTDFEEFADEICKNTNYQFYLKLTTAGDISPSAYIIDKANVPTATVLDERDIVSTSYDFNIVKQVSCKFKTRNEQGTLATDNYQFIESEKELSVINSDIPSGTEIKVNQMHDALGQQLNYLQAILDNRKKLKISVTIDQINKDILPGDNLNFTRVQDNVTCNQCLVREIHYDLNNQRTKFVGDGTITLLEKT